MFDEYFDFVFKKKLVSTKLFMNGIEKKIKQLFNL